MFTSLLRLEGALVSSLAIALGMLLLAGTARAQNAFCDSLLPSSPAFALYGCTSADQEGQEEVLEQLVREPVNAKLGLFFSAANPGAPGGQTIIKADPGEILMLTCYYQIRLAGETANITLRANPGQNLVVDVISANEKGNFTTITTELVYANTQAPESGSAVVECTGLAIPTS